jgi:hypothetical protein
MQKLMIEYGLRVNTVAAIKIKHLSFLNEGPLTIFLPDIKVNSTRKEEIEADFALEIEDYIEQMGNFNEEDYLFCRDIKLDVRKRATQIGKLINKKIQNTKVIKKNPNFKYSSHMFRKTKAYNIFQEGMKEVKERVRKSIGQAAGSTAVEHYINN